MSVLAASPETVETLGRRIAAVVAERQKLRATGAKCEALERNRLEIAHLQQRLSVALIARYRP